MADIGQYLMGGGTLLIGALVAYHNWRKDKVADLKDDIDDAKKEVAVVKALLSEAQSGKTDCEERYAALYKQLTQHLIEYARHMEQCSRERKQ